MAGALTTRALVLGVVYLFEPVNGYQVTRELTSWRVEDWAKLKPGSVYSMLNTLTRQEWLVRHDLPDGLRTIAVYQVSETGRSQFGRMIRAFLAGEHGLERPVLDTALAFAPWLPRPEVIAALEQRLQRMDQVQDEVSSTIAEAGEEIPPHVRHLLTLDHTLRDAERDWLADLRTRLAEGFLDFLGESDPWVPGEDDPGWEMIEQRRRYLDQIAKSAH